MMRELTREEIELLSIYRDREGTPAQTAEAERLLADSAEARNWLLQVDRAERLALGAARGPAGGGVDLSRITGQRIAAVAASGRRSLFGIRPATFLVSSLLVGLLVGGYALISPVEPDQSSSPHASATLLSDRALAQATPERKISFESLPATASATVETPAAGGGESEVRSKGRAGKSESISGARNSAEEGDVTEKADEKSGSPFNSSENAPPESSSRAPSGPLHLSINLHHSSARIIIGDDQWSDTLKCSNSEEELIDLSARLSSLTDSLNADVARIASDTTRSTRDRAGDILLRQMEYEAQVARELERLQKVIEQSAANEFDGAYFETPASAPAVTGLS